MTGAPALGRVLSLQSRSRRNALESLAVLQARSRARAEAEEALAGAAWPAGHDPAGSARPVVSR